MRLRKKSCLGQGQDSTVHAVVTAGPGLPTWLPIDQATRAQKWWQGSFLREARGQW